MWAKSYTCDTIKQFLLLIRIGKTKPVPEIEKRMKLWVMKLNGLAKRIAQNMRRIVNIYDDDNTI